MGQRVNEGYVITDSMHVGNLEFVIGENQTRYGTMYVTWECKNGDNYFFGHYISDRRAAEKDFLDRATQELEFQMQQNKSAEKTSKMKERER